MLAGVRIESADRDARLFQAEQPHGLIAQLDSAQNALRRGLARFLQRNVRSHVDRGQAFAPEQHTRFRRTAQRRDIFRMTGERLAGERHRFLVQGRGNHGVGFSTQAHFRGAANVLYRRRAAARVQLSENELSRAAQSAKIPNLRYP